MSVYKDQYVIVNVWTNTKNKALPGAKRVGHISITTPKVYISLWPWIDRQNENGFFKGDKGPFASWPASYKPDYEQDCIMEGFASRRQVGAMSIIEAGEIVYRHNPENDLYEHVTSLPRASNDKYYAIKPLEANFRMALYSLDIHKIAFEFDDLQDSVTGWSLMGSGMFREIQKKTKESCSSLAYRCLKAGGMYSNLKSGLSSQTCSCVDPEDLLRHVVAAKQKEVNKYPETAGWLIDEINEMSLEKVKKAYQEQGRHANVEDDLIPGLSFPDLYLSK